MKITVLAVLVTLALLLGLGSGCASHAILAGVRGDTPPHIYHPDRDHDFLCDRFGELMPGTTITKALEGRKRAGK